MKTRYIFYSILISLLLITDLSLSQDIPRLINYQGSLKDNNGKPVIASKTIIFRIYDSLTGGNKLWEEAQSVDIKDGIFNVTLGQGTEFPTNPDIFLSSHRYLEIEIDAQKLLPRQQILTVAYAFNAQNGVPIGTVIDWWRPSGSTNTIPTGYKICDGSRVGDQDSPFYNLSVPDLRNKFIRGVDGYSSIGQTGGGAKHSHAISLVTKGANMDSYGATDWKGSGTWDKVLTRDTHTHNVTGNTAPADADLPPYFGLLKIIRIK